MLNILADLDISQIQQLGASSEQITMRAVWHLGKIQKAWLLIFDNADQDIRHISSLPSSARGSAIIISRKPECCALDRPYSLSMPSIGLDDGVKLLWFMINVHSGNLTTPVKTILHTMVTRLCCFPMALRATSSAIVNDPSLGVLTLEQNLQNYLAKLEEEPGQGHALQQLWGSTGNDQEKPYAATTTFSTLLEGIKQQQQSISGTVNDAFDLLYIFSFWSSGDIPGSLLRAMLQIQSEGSMAEVVLECLAYIPDILRSGSKRVGTQEDRIIQAVGLLRKYSLVTLVKCGGRLEEIRWRMHPIFQECLRVSRFMDKRKGRSSTLQAFITLHLCAAAKKIHGLRTLRRSVLSHLESVVKVAKYIVQGEWFMFLFQELSIGLANEILLNFFKVYFDSGNLPLAKQQQQQYVYDKLNPTSPQQRELQLRA